MKLDTSKSTVQKIRFPIQENESFHFEIKRDDLIDLVVSGNKWRKLEYNLLQAEQTKKKGILTFGGAYSNHLVATAKAAKMHGFSSVGIVRGEELTAESNPTLKVCEEYGMNLVFVSRTEYKNSCTSSALHDISFRYPDYHIVPEGGKSYLGVVGCQHIMKETENDYSHVYLAGGTGTTAAGVLLSTPEKTIVHVVSALKGDFLKQDIKELVYKAVFDEEITNEYMQRLNVYSDSRFGGYGKVPEELIDFINEVYKKTTLRLDPIYTGKAFFKMIEDVKSGRIKENDKVLFIHTGGLQGANSWKEIDWVG